MDKQKFIRNFCIISHIDHGKSTLADRFLEITGTVDKRKMKEQFLDQMDLERERGITIKLQPVRMVYQINDSEVYILNLIDTPGHVDFSYEVSRSLAAVEGAVLLVDATQGVQAQTLANLSLAEKEGLVIIPAVNKIDLPNARIKETKEEISHILNEGIFAPKDILEISAKQGTNVEKVLKKIIERVPPPSGDLKAPFRALIFDSQYDPYKGVIVYIRVVDGQIKKGERILMMASKAKAEVLEVGFFRPGLVRADILKAGEIGYLATGLKEIGLCRVGETITIDSKQDLVKVQPLPGYQEPKPMVFASLYPSQEADFEELREALNKLKLNDASLIFEPEISEALGRGFKVGFLGMLHLEIITERLKREYGLELVITSPSVTYRVKIKNKDGFKEINSLTQLPDWSLIEEIQEPWIKLEVLTPVQYLGQTMKALQTLEGVYQKTEYLTSQRVKIIYEAPLREIMTGFYDKLKSATSGYASMGYEFIGFRKGDLVKLDILIAGEKVAPFSRLVPRSRAFQEGRALVKKLKEIIPPQLFAVALQAAVGGKIIARETIPALRKDVTGYLYGGDYTRKRKLLEKQKRGKKRLKQIGRVHLTPDIYIKALKTE